MGAPPRHPTMTLRSLVLLFSVVVAVSGAQDQIPDELKERHENLETRRTEAQNALNVAENTLAETNATLTNVQNDARRAGEELHQEKANFAKAEAKVPLMKSHLNKARVEATAANSGLKKAQDLEDACADSLADVRRKVVQMEASYANARAKTT